MREITFFSVSLIWGSISSDNFREFIFIRNISRGLKVRYFTESIKIINFYSSCHPHFASHWSDKIEVFIRENISLNKLVAIGECGLDSSKK